MICKACRDKRNHTKVEWRNHPLAGHGYAKETGWTHEDAKRLHDEEAGKFLLNVLAARVKQQEAAIMAGIAK